MSIKRVPMTPTGEKVLRQTLAETFKKIDAVAHKIAHAKAFGDLKENAEYNAAKQEQAILMQLSHTINQKLRHNQVIDPKKLVRDGKVVFGTTVHLQNIHEGESLTFQIVGEDEADIKEGKLSFSSPIAKGIIGKREKDDVKIPTLEGVKSFHISRVEYL